MGAELKWAVKYLRDANYKPVVPICNTSPLPVNETALPTGTSSCRSKID